MEKIFSDFGINGFLLAAQVVNFLVLLFILKKFLYKPILKMLEERKQKIADSLKQAEQIELTLQKTEEEKEKKLSQASSEASRLVEDAKAQVEEMIKEAHHKGEGIVKEMTEKANQLMVLEKEKMKDEVRKDAMDLVALALEKITGKVLNQKDQKQIIERSIKEI